MYFRYSLDHGCNIITDGSKALVLIQLKTEKLVKPVYEIEFFSGVIMRAKLEGMLTKKNFQVFSEGNELLGSITARDDYRQELFLDLNDPMILKQKYSFSYKKAFPKRCVQIKDESGTLIATLERKFIWKKFRSYLFIEEKDLGQLMIEDRLLIYAMAFVAQRILRR